MSAQNEQQLLEDASTLLMFANAAALSQTPGPTPPQGPPQQHQRSQSSPNNIQSVPTHTLKTLPTEVSVLNKKKTSLQPALATSKPNETSQAQYPPYHSYDQPQALVSPPTGYERKDPRPSINEKAAIQGSTMNSTPIQSQDHIQNTQNQIPSQHPIQHQITNQNQNHLQNQNQTQTQKQNQNQHQNLHQNSHPGPIHKQSHSQSHSQTQMQVHPGQQMPLHYNIGQYPSYRPPPLGPALGRTASRDAKSQGASPTYEKTQGLPPIAMAVTASAGAAPYKFPAERQRLVPLSPKPPNTNGPNAPANVAQNLNLSPRFSALPVQGSFRNSHKKAHSDGTQLKTKTSSSPALAFSRGINVESGQRRNDNAVIAAAALAAAADNPLPLIFKQSSPPNSDSAPNSTDKASSGSKAFSTGKLISEQNQIKTEDSVATEPEDDNKTEDELPPTSTEDHLVRIEGNPNALLASAIQTQETKPSPPKAEDSKSHVPPLSALVNVQAQVHVPAQEADIPVQKDATQKHMAIPPLESFKVDPDAGTIGCICGIEEDDGFTIQCDSCFRWQHCSCMGYVTSEEVPEDEYKCYFCDEMKWNKFDPEVCRIATIKRLDLDKFNEPPPEKEPAPKRKSSSSGNEDKKRRKSDKDVKGVAERPSSEKRKSSSAASPNMNSVATFEVINKNNPLLEGGVTAEAYQNVYYRLGDYDYKTPEVKEALYALGKTMEMNPTKPVECMSAAQLKQVKFSKVILPNHLKYLQDRNELQKNKSYNKTSLRVKAYSENPKQKFVGVSKMGLFITDSTVQAGSEVEIPSGTTVIEYLGEVDMWEQHMSNKVNQFSAWGTVKPKVAKVDIPTGENGTFSIVLDARFVGNEARFIRKSCPSTANCIIKPIYAPHLKKFKYHVVTTKPIVLKSPILDEELRISWEWDEHHPIRKMLKINSDGEYEEGQKFEEFSEEDRATLVSCVDTILNFVECACNTSTLNHQCSIFKVKKATSYLLRSTRKLSSLTNNSASKSREELVLPKKIKQYVSWKERLIERDNVLQASLLTADTEEVKHPVEKEVSKNSEEKESQNSPEVLDKPQIPLRKQLLARTQAPLQKYEITEEVTVELNVARSPTNSIQKSVAIPLTNKILKSIKERINDAFEPLEKPAGRATSVPTESPVAVAKEIKTESPVAAVAPHIDDEAPKPLAKKKLSFADYKKKMK